jgi:hypothetical protein
MSKDEIMAQAGYIYARATGTEAPLDDAEAIGRFLNAAAADQGGEDDYSLEQELLSIEGMVQDVANDNYTDKMQQAEDDLKIDRELIPQWLDMKEQIAQIEEGYDHTLPGYANFEEIKRAFLGELTYGQRFDILAGMEDEGWEALSEEQKATVFERYMDSPETTLMNTDILAEIEAVEQGNTIKENAAKLAEKEKTMTVEERRELYRNFEQDLDLGKAGEWKILYDKEEDGFYAMDRDSYEDPDPFTPPFETEQGKQYFHDPAEIAPAIEREYTREARMTPAQAKSMEDYYSDLQSLSSKEKGTPAWYQAVYDYLRGMYAMRPVEAAAQVQNLRDQLEGEGSYPPLLYYVASESYRSDDGMVYIGDGQSVEDFTAETGFTQKDIAEAVAYVETPPEGYPESDPQNWDLVKYTVKGGEDDGNPFQAVGLGGDDYLIAGFQNIADVYAATSEREIAAILAYRELVKEHGLEDAPVYAFAQYDTDYEDLIVEAKNKVADIQAGGKDTVGGRKLGQEMHTKEDHSGRLTPDDMPDWQKETITTSEKPSGLKARGQAFAIAERMQAGTTADRESQASTKDSQER